MNARTKRIIIILTVITILSAALCSCISKGIHVTVTDSSTLELMGNSYTKLTSDDPVIYLSEPKSITVYITNNGVPTFLSKALNNAWKSGAYMTNNGYFISYSGAVYCREDIYPTLAEITEYPHDACFYSYFSDGKQQCYNLSEEELSVINSVFDETEPIVSYELENTPDQTDNVMLCFYNSETDIISEYDTLTIYEDGYYFTRLREDNFTDFYFVPEELEPYFDSMTKAYTDALDN